MKPLPVCSASGCDRLCRSRNAGYCEAHYYQMRRNGHLGPKQRPEVTEHSGGYRLVAAPGHPMAKGNYRAYEHRVVFYDANGEGPFQCHVCNDEIGWDTMHVDHLDDDPTNNQIANLAPACPTCNQGRGYHKMKRTCRLVRSTTWVTWGGRTAPVGDWAEEIGISLTSMKRRLREWPLHRAMTEPRGKFGPPPSNMAA